MFVRYHHHAGWMGGWGGWGFGLLALGVLALLALLVVVVLIYRRQGEHRAVVAGASPAGWARPEAGRGPGTGAAHGSEAARILGERYARGEIDDEEYQRRLGQLRGPQ